MIGAPKRDRDGGFTLLEMLVAVAVLAALLAVIPRSFVQARVNFDRSQEWLRARLVAETVMTEELSASNLKPGEIRGEIDGRRWSATLDPNFTLAPRDNASGMVLLDVTVRVAMQGDDLELHTVRIGSPE